jgi:DNA replication protein DnaC
VEAAEGLEAVRRIRPHSLTPDDDGRDRFEQRLRESNLPERYWSARVETIESPKLRSTVQSLLNTVPSWLGEGRGWYIMGDLNAGKSSIASMLLMDAVRRAERPLWLPVRDVPGVRFREDDRKRALDERLAVCDLLVLDDLGAERFKLSSAGGTALEETVRIVYDRARSLIVTSNLSWRQMEQQYGAEQAPFVSVLRRLVEPVHVENKQWPGNA